MKKLIISIVGCLTAVSALAYETADLADLSDVASELNRYQELELWYKWERAPQVPISRALCYPNTFVWYLWQDYDAANTADKLKIFNQIETLIKGK